MLPKKKDGTPASNNWGGVRPGQGRPPKADEIAMISMIRSVMSKTDESDIWKIIIKKAKAGSKDHINIFLDRIYGKAREQVDIAIQHKQVIQLIRGD